MWGLWSVGAGCVADRLQKENGMDAHCACCDCERSFLCVSFLLTADEARLLSMCSQLCCLVRLFIALCISRVWHDADWCRVQVLPVGRVSVYGQVA